MNNQQYFDKLGVSITRFSCKVTGKKRQHFPYKITAVCPECGECLERDFEYDYLSYPVFGESCEVILLCYECDYESEPIFVVPHITLKFGRIIGCDEAQT